LASAQKAANQTEHFHQTGWENFLPVVIQLNVAVLNFACVKIFLSRFVSEGFQLFTLLQRHEAFLFKGGTMWITSKLNELAHDISGQCVPAEIAKIANMPSAPGLL
jgi:hypothetical protein